jgi:phosphohistidine swiveling domain-containing protein
LIGIKDIFDIKNIIKNNIDLGDRILLTETQDYELEPIIKKTKGVIATYGGRSGHIAIMGRELNISYVTGGNICITDIEKNPLCLLYSSKRIAVISNSWRYLGLLKDLFWFKDFLEYDRTRKIWKSYDGNQFKIIKNRGIFINKNNEWREINISNYHPWDTVNLKKICIDETICPSCKSHIKFLFFYGECSCGQKYHEICYSRLNKCLKCNKMI